MQDEGLLPRRGLSRVAAVPLAIGSIAGSGILSLPSAVYAEAGRVGLLVWIVAAAMCVPMLIMFRDTMRLAPGGDALQVLVARGTTDWIGAAMPLMFLFVVVVGLPTGCVIAGRYFERGLGLPGTAGPVAIGLLVASLLINIIGAHANNTTQLVGSAALIVTGVALIAVGCTHASHSVPALPDGTTGHVLLPGVLLAFWAFVGFENLTFLSRDLQDPERDFLPVSAAALAVYGVFAVSLTLTIAACIPRADVDPVAGLLQLSTNAIAKVAVALVAVSAMLINASAWVRGVSQLINHAARDRLLPSVLQRRPLTRTALLAVLFALTLTVLLTQPQLTVDALAASSAVFIIIYAVCIISYVRLNRWSAPAALNAALLVVMATCLIQSGLRSLYGVTIMMGCLAWCAVRGRRTAPA